MNIIDLSPTQTVLYSEVYVDSLFKTNGHIIVEAWSGDATWTDKCRFEPTGNGYFAGALTVVGDIASTFGNTTSSIGNVFAYGNLQSYNGHITAPLGTISGQSISPTSTLTATGHITHTSGNIASTSGHIQTLQGTLTGNSCFF